MAWVFLKESWGTFPGCVLWWARHICQKPFLLWSREMGWSGLYQLLASSNLRWKARLQTTVPEKACPRRFALCFGLPTRGVFPRSLLQSLAVVSLSFMGGEAWKPPCGALFSLASGLDAAPHVDNDVTRSPSPASTPTGPAWALSRLHRDLDSGPEATAGHLLGRCLILGRAQSLKTRGRGPGCQVNAEFNPVWQTWEPLGVGRGSPDTLAGWRRGARKPAEIRFSDSGALRRGPCGYEVSPCGQGVPIWAPAPR